MSPAPDRPLSRPRTRPRRRTVRRRVVVGVLCTLTLVAAATAGFAAVTAHRVTGTIQQNAVSRPGATEPAASIPDWDGPVDLLIMGSDSREGQDASFGTAEGARSDVLMLLHVSADHTAATLLSIPRDTMVSAPACTRADGRTVPARAAVQINATLDDGPYCTLDTVSALTGLDLQHFMVVDFAGVVDVTDAIGGVEVCVQEDVDDSDSGLHLTAGRHTIQGEEALAFLRTRHGFGDGSDLGRIAAQQTYLASLARTVTSAHTLSNPVALYRLADAASRSLSVDDALADPGALVALAGTLRSVDLHDMVLLQLPVRAWPKDHNRVEPDPAQAEAVFTALAEDRPLVLKAASGDAGTAAEETTTAEETPGGATEPETGSPVTLPPSTTGQTADTVGCAG